MHPNTKSEQFVRLLTENQNRIFGYVYSLLGDHTRAADVVQETNLVLWRKIDEFEPLRPFLPWAFGIARMQVLAHLRDQKRDRLLLDAELAETLSAEVEVQAEELDALRAALRPCMQHLANFSHDLVSQRYFKSRSIAELAEYFDRSVSSIKVSLLRIRRQLADCLQKHISETSS